MRSIRAFILPIGLISLLAVMAAFKNLPGKRAMKNWQTAENSKGFAVVELFTSEGCSSCPPADELIDRIQKENNNGQIYIMAFHVDYWDRLGWKDRFSDPEFSNRQRQYANWLNLQTVYTPQIVVNGVKEYVGSDRGAVLGAISTGLDQEPVATLTLNSRIEGRKLTIEYEGAGEVKRSELVLALIQRSAQSSVKAGENAGKNLSHVQIVRRTLHVPIGINGKKSITMDLPGDFDQKGWELIGFVQHKTDGHIIAAQRFDFQSGPSGNK